MRTSYIVLAIPVFLILIIVEYSVSLFKKKELYSLNDFINNISTGSVEQLGCAFFKTLLFIPYIYIFEHFALFTIDYHSFIMWLIVWVLADFFYYWLHRGTHRITFLWAGHSVHHQSEHFNLSVALRQGIIQTLFGWVFYLPIALMGFPPAMLAVATSLNTLYQFWIHTPFINKMGILEYIINTPSHHRVHHGKNPQYIDKNYAGSLILWDKLFGTFEKEDEPVDYGVTEPLDSWNPFYANIKVLKDTWYYSRPLKKLTDRILCFIMPPEWVVEKIGVQAYMKLKRPATRPQLLPLPTTYLKLNIVLLIAITFFSIVTFDLHEIRSQGLVIISFLSLFLLGHIMDGGRYALFIENTRNVCLLIFFWPIMTMHLWFLSIILMITITNNYLLHLPRKQLLSSPG